MTIIFGLCFIAAVFFLVGLKMVKKNLFVTKAAIIIFEFMQENHILMFPFVVMMAVNTFTPFFVFVRSEEVDAINLANYNEDELHQLKIVGIFATVIYVILAIYFFFVSFAVWKNVKE